MCIRDRARMRRLEDGSEIPQKEHWNLREYPEYASFFLNPSTSDSYPLPDPVDTVVELTLREEWEGARRAGPVGCMDRKGGGRWHRRKR